MKIYALTILAALLVQASVLVQGGAGWGGKESAAPEKELVAEKAREASPLSDGADDMPESSTAKSPSPARAWKIAGDTGATARSHSKPATKPQLGSSKQNATSKQQRPQPQQALRAKNNGLSNFLKGHGKFNSDTVSITLPPPFHLRPWCPPNRCIHHGQEAALVYRTMR